MEKEKNWGVFYFLDDIHILPNNDEHTHAVDVDCACGPSQEYHHGVLIVTHNSFDGREGVEWANELLDAI